MTSQNSEYDSWHDHHKGDNDIATAWHEFAKESLGDSDINQKTVLEIGCGRGGFSSYLIQRYPTIQKLLACDYSESAIAIGREKVGKSELIEWRREDIQNLSFADSSIDTAISLETIEHIKNPGKGLSEIYRVLKHGGKFVLTCPNYFNLFGIWCVYRKIIGKPYTEGGQPYVNYILMPSIYFKLRSLGFEVEHYHSIGFVLPLRRPRVFFSETKCPSILRYLGGRTFYILRKV